MMNCLNLIGKILDRDFHFRDKEQVREAFVRLTKMFKNLNYAQCDSDEYRDLVNHVEALRANQYLDCSGLRVGLTLGSAREVINCGGNTAGKMAALTWRRGDA